MYRMTLFHANPKKNLPRLIDYYTDNSSSFNRERDPIDLISVINDRSVVSILDRKSKIHGISLSIPYHEDLHVEFGGTRVTLNGYGLQVVMYQFQTLYTYFYDSLRGDVFAITEQKNIGSLTNLKRAHFREFSPEKAFLAAIAYNNVHTKNKVYLRITKRRIENAAIDAAKKLLEIQDSGFATKGDKKIEFVIDDPLFQNPVLLAKVRELASLE